MPHNCVQTRHTPLLHIVAVLRADSPGKAAQWFTESIPESWGVLWLVIRFFPGRADISPSLSACWISPPPLPVFLLLRVGGLSRLNTPAVHSLQLMQWQGRNSWVMFLGLKMVRTGGCRWNACLDPPCLAQNQRHPLAPGKAIHLMMFFHHCQHMTPYCIHISCSIIITSHDTHHYYKDVSQLVCSECRGSHPACFSSVARYSTQITCRG
jgi:hypothetical protein